jgi:hypothetical protein
MSERFLETFLQVAEQIARAERGLAVDADLNILKTLNLKPDVVETEEIRVIAMAHLRNAMSQGQAIITNNVISDPSLAPVTNTNFANLRMVIVIPVGDLGAIYLDQPVRHIVKSEVVERLQHLAVHCLKTGQTDLSATALEELYDTIH